MGLKWHINDPPTGCFLDSTIHVTTCGPSCWPTSLLIWGPVKNCGTFWDNIWGGWTSICMLCGCSPEDTTFPPAIAWRSRSTTSVVLGFVSTQTLNCVINKLAYLGGTLTHPRCQLLPERPTCHRNSVAGEPGGERLQVQWWMLWWWWRPNR